MADTEVPLSTVEERFVQIMGMSPQKAKQIFNLMNAHGMYLVPVSYMDQVEDLQHAYSALAESQQHQRAENERLRTRGYELADELKAARVLIRQWELRLVRVKEIMEEV